MAYEQIRGKSVIPAADLADLTADCNLVYPNGIGKTNGLMVYADAGSDVLTLVMANGSAANSTWTTITESTAADVAAGTYSPV